MNRIRLLPEQVANQIAAGEVVERPASVVKELVENALDAQATRITIEIQAGGRSLIRVTDDGVGMSRDDALLCLEPHATSKILRAEDLAAIGTMGFRGEALPSIASVSRFVVTTRERDAESPEGTRVNVNGGKIAEVKAAASAPGTSVEVRQLFFNLPARRKFLRTEETESAHIQHYLNLAALAFPEVSFTFVKDGRTIWQLPAVKAGQNSAGQLPALQERLRALYGGNEKLLPLDVRAEIGDRIGDFAVSGMATAPIEEPAIAGLRVWGFLGAPGVSRATREDQHLFVNRRPVENRGLNYALLEGYHTALMKGRYPVCCLFLEIDPGAVDVNIHPAKREVRFHNESSIRRAVTQAVRQTLLEFHSGKTEATQQTKHSSEELRSGNSSTRPSQSSLPEFPPELQPAPEQLVRLATQAPLPIGFGAQLPMSQSARPEAARPEVQPIIDTKTASTGAPAAEIPTRLALAASMAGPVERAAPLLDVPLRLLGVIGRLYVVLESDRGLVLLDQHAAHERVLFEQMLTRLEQGSRAHSQKLLLPETVEVSARDADFLREQLPVLSRLGVGLSEFGERTFLLDALPPFVKVADHRRFVIQILDELRATGQQINSLRLGEQVVAKTVCRHAVKANDPLSGLELEKLISDLRVCAMPYTCPHGRPTLIEMNFRELEKKFGRTQ